MIDTAQEGMRRGIFMSDKNKPCQGTSGKSSDETKIVGKMTKLDQMIEELNKKNPGRDIKKVYGGIY